MTVSLPESAQLHLVPKVVRVLLVEDERDISNVIRQRLIQDGMAITTTTNSAEALAQLQQFEPDIIVMDVRLGREDGITLAGTMRETTDAPILFVSGASTPDIRSRAFECGLSDFVPKPFALSEFCARLRALLRAAARAEKPRKPSTPMAPATTSYEFAGWRYIPAQRRLIAPSGLTHSVRQAHFELLNSFMTAPDHLVSFEQVALEGVNPGAPETLRSNIKTLRRLLGADNPSESIIQTAKKKGYQLAATVVIHDPMAHAAD